MFTKVQAAKPLKCLVTQQSTHRSFWSDDKEVVKSTEFYAFMPLIKKNKKWFYYAGIFTIGKYPSNKEL